MKRQAKLPTVLIAAALSAGCASGGGSEGGWEGTPLPQPTPTAEMRCVWFLPFICGWFEPDSDTAISAGFRFGVAPEGAAAPFTSWAALAPLQEAEFAAVSSTVSYARSAAGEVTSTSAPTPPEAQLVVRREHAPQASVGGMNVTVSRTADGLHTRLSADPDAQGWSYQSFGIWDRQLAGGGTMGASSFGAATPAAAVPASGAASFTGRLGGLYVSPAGQGSVASADLRVDADFGRRSLGFASSGTTLTGALPAPHLDLSGTLTYAPSANAFSGALTSAGGMSGASRGQFYGPAAQELGGVFTVKSAATVETFTGGYGAKR